MYESVKIIIWNIWSKPTQSDLSNYNLKKSQFLLTKKIYWHSHSCYYKCFKLRVLHFENFSRIFKKNFLNNFHFFFGKMDTGPDTQADSSYLPFWFLRNGMGPGYPGRAYIYENQPSKTPILNYWRCSPDQGWKWRVRTC